MTNVPLNFLMREPAEVYHARAKDCLTSHTLSEFRRCPLFSSIPRVCRPSRASYRRSYCCVKCAGGPARGCRLFLCADRNAGAGCPEAGRSARG